MGRLIITATGAGQRSLCQGAEQGGGEFSDPFFDALSANNDLWTGYQRATESVRRIRGTQQTPVD
ncbi:MAG: hypothetical protein IPO15_22055 [Anaerolineae bacterium]|uniref:hypothetical protein n=1 Tax=Candidatus Amarolinea dominans TaxID=3140696 RepID=UPI003134B764|nr:hypothetical protein [Anaerolineae bacterium]